MTRKSKKIISTMAAALVLMAASSGCRTSTVSSTLPCEGQKSCDGSPVLANLRAENHGYYLFGFIPLWSGDPRRPNARFYVTFRDRVDDKGNLMMMENRLRRDFGSAKVADYSSREYSSGLLTLFIVWHKALLSQAVAVPDAPSE